MKRAALIATLGLAALMVEPAGAYAYTEVCGGSGAEGSPAREAVLEAPTDVDVDVSGDLYVAERCRIRRIDPTGTITTVAGTNTATYSNEEWAFNGDGGPATQAEIHSPSGIGIRGNKLYIATSSNGRIRRVDLTTGIIETVAGGGPNATGGNGPALLARIHPTDVDADDSGQIYISECIACNNASYGPHRVRKVDAAGTMSTYLGDGTFWYNGNVGVTNLNLCACEGMPTMFVQILGPNGVEVGADGEIFVAMERKVARVLSPGIYTTYAGRGHAGNGGAQGFTNVAKFADIEFPRKVALSQTYNLYVPSDCGVRRVTPLGFIEPAAGRVEHCGAGTVPDGIEATSARFAETRAVAAMTIAQGDVIFVLARDQVYRVEADRSVTRVAGVA